jgi:hypothetical protein
MIMEVMSIKIIAIIMTIIVIIMIITIVMEGMMPYTMIMKDMTEVIAEGMMVVMMEAIADAVVVMVEDVMEEDVVEEDVGEDAVVIEFFYIKILKYIL